MNCCGGGNSRVWRIFQPLWLHISSRPITGPRFGYYLIKKCKKKCCVFEFQLQASVSCEIVHTSDEVLETKSCYLICTIHKFYQAKWSVLCSLLSCFDSVSLNNMVLPFQHTVSPGWWTSDMSLKTVHGPLISWRSSRQNSEDLWKGGSHKVGFKVIFH